MKWPSLETTPKTITIAGNFVYITLGTLNHPDLHFEGAGNGLVVITWIGREHELYSGASPISLVELTQYQVESYQRLKKSYLMPLCLTFSIIRYGSRIYRAIQGKK